ncbi:MAG TPA: hypothetical protein VKE96_08435, partial [Vicinamibacterales bacterium]|nr:hypothetical protein [Vicinamibacterales bacterium]
MTTRDHTLIGIVLTICSAAGCTRPSEVAKAEPTTLSVTDWSAKTELYMEYPPLVTGRSALFAVHLTKLDDFKALNAGTPTIEFAPERGGAATVLRGSPPSRPGAFRVEGVPPSAGRYRWALLVDAPGLTDRHDLGITTVFADEPTARAEADKRPADDPSAIAYLKEQQWTNEFATARVMNSDLRISVKVPAEIEPLSGGEAVITAPAAGRFVAASLVSIGTNVGVGQTLGRLEPRLAGADDRATLVSELVQAQVALDSAQ